MNAESVFALVDSLGDAEIVRLVEECPECREDEVNTDSSAAYARSVGAAIEVLRRDGRLDDVDTVLDRLSETRPGLRAALTMPLAVSLIYALPSFHRATALTRLVQGLLAARSEMDHTVVPPWVWNRGAETTRW
jgi:hypothetical protein